MRRCSHLVGYLAALALLGLTGPAAADSLTAEQRLAGRMLRSAQQVMASENLNPSGVELAGLIAAEAVALDDASADAWRMLLEIAEFSEDRETRIRALDRLVVLDPSDEVIRLRHVMSRIDQFNTVEQRSEAYQRLLAPQQRESLGPAVASRLALDLALLERRRGDTDAFARWLAEAVALDQTNKAAAAIAAGYFRMNVDDAFGETELLVSLLLADPVDVVSQTTLAGHLLGHGAYEGAARLYTLASETYAASRRQPPDDLLADLAMAQWAAGDHEAALRTIRERQRHANLVLRTQLQREQPDLTSLQRARHTAVLEPTLATVRAAIHRRIGDDGADAQLEAAVQAYQVRIDQQEQEDQPDQDLLARLRLELAWVMLWLGGSLEQVQALLELVEAQQPLTDQARARFAGWIALRSGDAAEALSVLRPHVGSDAAGSLGHATAQIELGQVRDGARELLALARSQPGTLIGIWASNHLWQLLGQKVHVGDEAARDMEALVAAIPAVVDRFPSDPNSAVSMRLTPTKSTFAAYEPVIVNVEITNHAPFPIAISSTGPIQPQVALVPSAEVAWARQGGPMPPIVVNIDRKLRLMPRERLVIPVELRRSQLGALLDRHPIQGAIVRARAYLNFTVSERGVVRPGLLGCERETSPFRVDGYRLTAGWVEQTMAAMVRAHEDVDVTALAAISHLAVSAPAEGLSSDQRQIFVDAAASMNEAFGQLRPAEQAWLLAVMPNAPALESALAAARRSEHRLVRLSYLLFRVSRADDPMVAAVLRGDDPTLRRLAELVEPLLAVEDDLGLPRRP